MSIKTLGMAEASKILPEANLEDIEVALYEPDAGYADPVATTYAFAKEAKRHGETILTLSLIHIRRCRLRLRCRSLSSPYH